MKKMKNLKARMLSMALAFVMALSLAVGVAPMEVEAANFYTPIVDTSSITLYPSGCLEKITITVQTSDYYAKAFGRIGIHNARTRYDWNNRFISSGCTSWPDESQFVSKDTTFITFADGDEFEWTDQNQHTITFGFPDGKVDLSQTQTYYIYLWTRSEYYGIYTDATIGTLKTEGGKLLDGSGNTLVEKPAPHQHSWSENWANDENNHWKTCNNGCAETDSSAPHADGTDEDNKCDTCGYDIPPAHIHSLTEVPAVEATCTADGNYKYYTCDCGKFFKADGTTETTVADETIPASHSWLFEKNERGHWKECSNCDEIDDEYGVRIHKDEDSNNKCDDCEYVTHRVTFVKDNASNANFSIYDSNDIEFISNIVNHDSFNVPANCIVKVSGIESFVVSAPGAKIEYVTGEGNNCFISDFTRNTTIVVNPTGTGSVVANANVNAAAPIQSVALNNSIDEFIVASNIFTDSEIANIANGVGASVRLAVSKIDNVDIDQKDAMEDKVAELGANTEITYFDASFFKKIGNNPEESISDPGMDIEITIEIPSSLLNTDTTKTRTYKLLRYHDVAIGDDVTVIEGTFSNGKFTFTTNKFSTYAIIYTDTAVTNPGGGNPGGNTGSNPGSSSGTSGSSTTTTTTTTATVNQQLVKDSVPKTGESADYTAMVWTAILAISVVGLLVEKQKRRQ